MHTRTGGRPARDRAGVNTQLMRDDRRRASATHFLRARLAHFLRARLAHVCALACLMLLAPAHAQENGARRDARFYEREAAKAHEAKDYAAYLENMKAAVQLRPDHPRLLYNLAGAHALAGDKAEALRLVARVASMGLYYPAERDTDFDSVKDTDEFKSALRRFAASREPTGTSTTAFVLKERGLVTEGLAYDPHEKVFYVSSAYRRKILRVDARGEARDFATEREGLLSVLGMKVDAKRRHLWVAANANKLMTGFDASADGTAAVYRFDLKTGKLAKRYLLANAPRKHGFGDLAVHPNGDVYVTDSLTPAVYRITRERDELELFLEDEQLASPQGLDFSPDGRRLFFADYSRGLFAVELATKKLAPLAAPPDASVLGIDGLYFHRGRLVAVQNGTNPHRVVSVSLNNRQDAVASVAVVEANNPRFDEPTLGVIVGDTFYYVAASGWGAFDREGKLAPPERLKEHIVLKVKL
ncbi:MAG TPA: SMP-30/gluconolactonase/LRE family protein [Pyrinomonadaceae bacterium]|nr:SMP-30/gluconolactonase/LRE family protein [Pyrinomonadaceae bacterium]